MTVCTKTVQALPSGAAAARVPVFGVVGADGHTARVEVAGILVRQRVRYSLHPVRGGILYLRLKQRLNDLRPGLSAAPHGGAHRGNALHLMAVFDSVGDFYSFTNAIRERDCHTEKQRICALPGAGGTLLTRRKRRICS